MMQADNFINTISFVYAKQQFDDPLNSQQAEKLRYFLALPIFFSFCATSAYAQGSHSHNDKNDTKQHAHSWHRNHFSVFIGAMSPVDTADETSVALGFDYERRFTESIGLELLSDFAIGAHNRSVLFTTSLTWRPFRDYGLNGI